MIGSNRGVLVFECFQCVDTNRVPRGRIAALNSARHLGILFFDFFYPEQGSWITPPSNA